MGADVGVRLEEGFDGFGEGEVAELEFGDFEVFKLCGGVLVLVGEVGRGFDG